MQVSELGNENYTYRSTSATTATTTNVIDSIFDENKPNSCTDGKDDGKISFASKVLNIGEGAIKCAGKMIKGIIKHPIKTALAIGACCIPVVGPVIAAGFAGYGLISGLKQVGTAYKNMKNATTDAQAKAACENMGAGGLTAGISAVALKGSVGQFKAQTGLNGEAATSNTFDAVKEAWDNGESYTEICKTAIKNGKTETMANMKEVAKGIDASTRKKLLDNLEKIKNKGLTDKNIESTLDATEEFAGELGEELVEYNLEQNGEAVLSKTKLGKSSNSKSEISILRTLINMLPTQTFFANT